MPRWMAPPHALSRRWKSVAAALLALVAAVLAAPSAGAETRFALVIGNGAYRNVPALNNPPSDAKDIAAALKSLGFKVTLKLDLDLAAMQRSIDEFALESADADVSLLYYAGHGFQLAGRNYLVPVGAELRQIGDIASRTVALDPVLAELGKGKGSHLVFLDACRNNPFAAGLPAAGLARVGKLPGFFITFATQPDNVAFDGTGRNSPFARALLGRLSTPGADISSMMIAVRNDVFAETGGQQIPADEVAFDETVLFRRRRRPRRRLRRSSGALPERTEIQISCKPISTATPTDLTPPMSALSSRESERPLRRPALFSPEGGKPPRRLRNLRKTSKMFCGR